MENEGGFPGFPGGGALGGEQGREKIQKMSPHLILNRDSYYSRSHWVKEVACNVAQFQSHDGYI